MKRIIDKYAMKKQMWINWIRIPYCGFMIEKIILIFNNNIDE